MVFLCQLLIQNKWFKLKSSQTEQLHSNRLCNPFHFFQSIYFVFPITFFTPNRDIRKRIMKYLFADIFLLILFMDFTCQLQIEP